MHLVPPDTRATSQAVKTSVKSITLDHCEKNSGAGGCIYGTLLPSILYTTNAKCPQKAAVFAVNSATAINLILK